FLLATPLVATCGLVYLYFTIIMPRSGGDYVWVSRTLNPFLGFFTNFSLTFVFLTWIAFNFTYMLSVMGPSVAFVAGWNAGWLTSPDKTELMVISTILTVVFTGVMILGVRVVAKYMAVLFAIVWIGMLAWLIDMLIGGHGTFTSNFAAHSGTTVPGARAQGRIQRGRRHRLGRHRVRHDLLLPGLHRLPVDRVLRRRDPQRPPDRYYLDPRRAAHRGHRLRRRRRAHLQVLRLQLLRLARLRRPRRRRVQLEGPVPAVPARAGPLPARPAVAAGVHRHHVPARHPVVDADRVHDGHAEHVRLVVRPARAGEADDGLRPVPHAGDRHHHRRRHRRAAQLPEHLPGPGQLPAEHHRGHGRGVHHLVHRRRGYPVAAAPAAHPGTGVGSRAAGGRPRHHDRGSDFRY